MFSSKNKGKKKSFKVRGKILVVDDDKDMCSMLEEVLSGEGFSLTTSTNSGEAIKFLKKDDFDIIITDLMMHGLKGLDLLEESKKIAPLTPVIIITAFGSIESAIKAMKMGAYDYITKPFQLDELIHTVKKAMENHRLKEEVNRLKREVAFRYQFHNIIGRSNSMQKIYDLIERISDTSSNVLITGESGTGKELVAKAIHYNGKRREGRFVAVNCAAIPENLLESELFGYRRGAFTDAKTDKRGLIFEAHEGTLFLDEITEMAYPLQAKLLRVIEEKKVRPLGDTQSYPVDLRVIATSNQDVKALIQQGRFREDLYYRLKVVDIEMPPLRERKEDIILLAENFLKRFNKEMGKEVTGISEEVKKIMLNYYWPGNVRELENIIHRAVTLCRQKIIYPEDLPISLTQKKEENILEKSLQGNYSLEQLEKEYIKKILMQVGGNKSRAAEILGLDRKTLYRKLKEL